jgi:hypothetical protein
MTPSEPAVLLSPDSIIVATRAQLSAVLDGETVILNVQSGIYYGLENVGMRVWTLLEKPIAVSKLCDILSNEYEVQPGQCTAEITALLEQLLQAGLIEIQG